MNKVILIIVFFTTILANSQKSKIEITNTLNNWHKAASVADFDAYFDLMTKDGVFIGTDATENWQNKAFREFSKPHFDAGKAWNFNTIERNIYLNDAEDFAWFDELLDTQMKICRGSGVLKKEDGKWRIAHYVLSIAVPNDNVDALILLKKENDSLLTIKLNDKAKF